MANSLSRIQHVVVLMLENRSLDHMLGYLKAQGLKPGLDGLLGTEAIPEDPTQTGSPAVAVSPTAPDVGLDPDPGHELIDVSHQLYGHPDPAFPPGGANDGFVASYAAQASAPADPRAIMKCFAPGAVPALTQLARQFCVCNAWFSSVPGPTWPNRLFAHAGTSGGHVTNDLDLYFLPTIFDRLDSAGRKWRIYYHDIPQALLFWSLWDEWIFQFFNQRFRPFDRFAQDLAAASASTCGLPAYTFIEPRYFTFWDAQAGRLVEANDQHPPHRVSLGEHLIADVYDALRNSPCWRHSLLIVLYDEHGGTYDHRFPAPPAVNPDGLTSTNPAFDFTRYGVRVPAVIVSPWASKRVCNTVHDHTAILRTVEQRFGLPPLTARDAAASGLGECLTRRTPRLTPWQAPRYLPRPALSAPAAARPRSRVISQYQRGLVDLALRVAVPGEKRPARPPSSARVRTEQHGAAVVRDRMAALRAAARRARRG